MFHALLLLLLLAPAPGQNPYRPQVHFSPAQHWTNDPNGLVYFEGEYHLFFQYNPFGDVWGHMSWGHAVSKDLLHWQELPVAIPEQNGVMAFTGSVVVDENNTSKLCAAGAPCMVAVYTGYQEHAPGGGTRQAQYLAYSRDKGRTWTNHSGNPVIDLKMADFRDPSVFWDEPRHHWVMAVSLPKEHKIRLYASQNLKQWTELSDFGPAGNTDGDWECPDLLQVPSAAGKRTLWAMKIGLNPGAPQGGSGEQYALGTFDGVKFTPATGGGAWGLTNHGKDDYCAISFNHLPRGEKPVLLGWMSNWRYAAKLPTSPWRGQMSLPRRLSYVEDKAGLALKQEPIVEALRVGDAQALSAEALTKGVGPLHAPLEVALTFEPKERQSIRLQFDATHYVEIGFDKDQLYVDRTHSSVEVAPEFPARTTARTVASRPFDVRMIIDRSSIEVFAQDGTIAMTNLIFPPTSEFRLVKVESASKVTGTYWKLASAMK